MYFSSSGVLPADYYYRYYGFSVRNLKSLKPVGIYRGTSLKSYTLYADVWSCTYYNNINAYNLDVGQYAALPSSYYERYCGLSVRFVFESSDIVFLFII